MPKLGVKNRQSVKDSSRGAPAAKAKQKRSKSKGTSQQQLSAAQLFERAQAAIAFERYDAALECLRDALELEPENVEIIDARGALLAELGREEEAVQELRRAVQLSPDTGFEKYMYLGQLLEGDEALHATQKGVELLQQDVNAAQECGGGGSAEHRQLCKQLSAALCSLAEMRMGLVKDGEEVSGDAEALLHQARAVDPASPEPLQALASLRYEQGAAEEALQLLRQSMALWFKPQGGSGDESDSDDDDDGGGGAGGGDSMEEAVGEGEFRIPKKPVTMSEEEGEGRRRGAGGAGGSSSESEWEDADDDDGDDGDVLPSYEFRFECAKMLLELEDTTETAVQVLEDLLAEADGVLDVWHLLGLSYYSGGMLDEAAEVCKHGMQLMQQQQVASDEGIALAFDDLQSAISEAQAAAHS